MLSIESLLALGVGGDAVSMLPPCDTHIHVTDTLDASGAFVLLHYGLVALHASAHNVVWVSCRADGVAHWNSVTRKAGMPLTQYLASGELQMVDAEQYLGAEEPLSALFDAIHGAIRVTQTPNKTEEPNPPYLARTLVIVDDLSILQWNLPGSMESVQSALTRFLLSLRELCVQQQAALLTLQHADACSAVNAQGTLDEGDELLFRYILRTADIWIGVNELPSGRAADCDGELTVHGLSRCAAAATACAPKTDEDLPLQAFRLDQPSETCLFRIVPDGTGPKNANGVRSSVKIWSRGSGQGLA